MLMDKQFWLFEDEKSDNLILEEGKLVFKTPKADLYFLGFKAKNWLKIAPCFT